jgi:PleD family two-component response regulator
VNIPVRYGGDEILVVLTANPISAAVKIAERMRNAIKKLIFLFTADGQEISFSHSESVGCN